MDLALGVSSARANTVVATIAWYVVGSLLR